MTNQREVKQRNKNLNDTIKTQSNRSRPYYQKKKKKPTYAFFSNAQ